MQAEPIMYRDLESPLGTLVAGATSKGCCFLEFKDQFDLNRTRHRIKKQYNVDMISGTNPLLDQLESELEQYFSGVLQEFSIPLDLKGTPFQLAVWEQLLNIPHGEMTSYGEIARLLEKPLAVRAVGRANGDNPLAIVVPCHRIIRSDGQLGGYGGGLWRKKRLLTLEGHESFLLGKKKVDAQAKVIGSQAQLEKWFS
jgi:AraC family transcriptional regulator of adaptative response/methylated-DNA-[protein]-cysteine methyltransferase